MSLRCLIRIAIDNAYAEVQIAGKTRSCEGSPFRELYDFCLECINKFTSSPTGTYYSPEFEQFLDYCNSAQPVPTELVSSTTSEATESYVNAPVTLTYTTKPAGGPEITWFFTATRSYLPIPSIATVLITSTDGTGQIVFTFTTTYSPFSSILPVGPTAIPTDNASRRSYLFLTLFRQCKSTNYRNSNE